MLFGLTFFSKSVHAQRTNLHGQKPSEMTLLDIPAGASARMVDFLPGMPLDRQSHLRAYGLVAGVQVHVVQHTPVTIIQIEQLELALEWRLARQVQVEIPATPGV